MDIASRRALELLGVGRAAAFDPRPAAANIAVSAANMPVVLPAEKAKPPRLRGLPRWAVLGSNQ
jgi:hypothetical protein